MPVKERPASERFHELYDRRSDDECWPWTGYRNKQGYGIICGKAEDGRHKRIMAHRLSLKLHTGHEPKDLVCCHECDNPSCVNPNHLTWETQAYNLQGARDRGRISPPPRGPKRVVVRKGEESFSAKLTEKDVLEIYRIRIEKGLSAHHIAPIFGVSWQAIGFILDGSNWSHLLGTQGAPTAEELRAASNRGGKISAREIPIVRDLIKGGKTDKEIAETYNVTTATIWNIRTGRTWGRIKEASEPPSP